MNKLLAQNAKQEKISILTKVITKLIGSNLVQEENDYIFVTLIREKDNTSFLLKIIFPDNFPLEPANYIFVNPKTKVDDDSQFWPSDNQQAFKVAKQNPRWICIAGTSEYKHHHNGAYDPTSHSLSSTVINIYKQINGVN